MANEPKVYVPPSDRVTAAPPADSADVLATLTDALAKGITDAVKLNSPPRQIAFGEYKSRNSKNPTGRPDADRELTEMFFMNGDRIRERKLNDEELALIPHLRPGKFVDGLVVVQQFEKDGRRALNLIYKNKEIADRMAMKAAAPRLLDMLRRCVTEAADPAPVS